jgi:hypothetical protein
MVIVEIGPEHTTYRIQKALLMYHSDYFRKALQKCWKEGEERKVVIEDLISAPHWEDAPKQERRGRGYQCR